jgi:hypothetical protein
MCGFIGDILDDIGDAVRDVADWTGDAIRDVGDAAGDAVDWVVDGVEDIVDGLLDDPIKTIATAAALVIPGGAVYIPLINAVDAIEEGGDPLAAFASMVLPTVVSTLTDAVNLADAIGTTMTNVVGETAVNVVTTGGDIGAIVLGEIAEQAPAVTNFISSVVDTTVGALGVDTSTLAGQTFASNLNNVATAVLTAEVKGQDGLQAGTIAAVAGAGNSMIKSIGGDTLTEEQSNNISNILAAGFQAGDNAADAMSAAAEEIGQDALKEGVDEFFSSDEQVDEVVGDGVGEDVKEEIEEFQDATAGEVKVEELEDPELDARIPEGIQDPSEIEPVPEELIQQPEITDAPKITDAPEIIDIPEELKTITEDAPKLRDVTESDMLPTIPEELETKDDVPEFMDSDYLEFLEDISDAGEPVSQLDDSVLDMPAPPDVEIEDIQDPNYTSPRLGYESFDDLLQSQKRDVLDLLDVPGSVNISSLEGNLYGEGLGELVDVGELVTMGSNFSDVLKNMAGNTLEELIAGIPEGAANLTDQGIDKLKEAARGMAEAMAEVRGETIDPNSLTMSELEKWINDPRPTTLAQDFVDPFVTATRDKANEIYDSMSSYGKLAKENSQITGDVTFYDTRIPMPGGGTLKLPVGIENASLGKNPTIFGTVLNATGGLIDIVADVGLAFLGPAGLATSIGLNTLEAAGNAAAEIEARVARELKNPSYLRSDEYQRALNRANGDPSVASLFLMQEAKSLLLGTGLVEGLGDATVGKIIANGVSNVGLRIAGVAGTEYLTEGGGQTLTNIGLGEVIPEVEMGANVHGTGAMAVVESGLATTSAGAFTPKQDTSIENIQEVFETIDTPSKITTTTPSEVDVATEALKELGLDSELTQQVLQNAGIIGPTVDTTTPTIITPAMEGDSGVDTSTDMPPSVVDMVQEISNEGGVSIETAQNVQAETGASIEAISNAANEVINVKNVADTNNAVTTIQQEVLDTGGLSLETAQNIENTTPLNMTNINQIAIDTLVTPETTVDAKPESIVDPTTDVMTTINTAVNAETPILEESKEKEEKEEEILSRLGYMPVTVDPSGVADIDYLYDFSSIFATPEQEKAFTTPFKQYTNVQDPLSSYDVDMFPLTGTPYNLESEEDTAQRLLDLIRST